MRRRLLAISREFRRVGLLLALGQRGDHLGGSVVEKVGEPSLDDDALLQAIEAARRAQDEDRVRAIREAFEPAPS